MVSIDKRIGWIGLVLLLCFILLFVQLNNLQVKQAKTLLASPYNKTTSQSSVQPFFQPRGEIVSADGTVLAYSTPSRDAYKFQRVYPRATATMFAGITGYYANAVGADPLGVEASYDQYLRQHESPVDSLGSLLDQHSETDDVYLTISTVLQKEAMDSLDSSESNLGGGIVLIDPRNGDILAMYGSPSYNPNLFAAHDPAKVDKLAAELTTSERIRLRLDPLINYAMVNTGLSPGSTFKVITTSAAYDHKALNYNGSIVSQIFQPTIYWHFPMCNPTPDNSCSLHNYGYETCPSSAGGFTQILPLSCDAEYGEIGYELGIDNLDAEARSFGFDSAPPIDLPVPEGATSAAWVSSAQQVQGTTGLIADTAIGQFDDTSTPLEMALVAAGIADNGTIMTPHVVEKAVNSYGNVEFSYKPHAWLQATTPATATAVRQLMTGVTRDPGATATQLFTGWYQQGLPVMAAKTGTAEQQSNTSATYNWLIATGPAATGQTPTIAAAVVIPVTQHECESGDYQPTGASVAGPVLLPVLQEAFKLQAAGAIP